MLNLINEISYIENNLTSCSNGLMNAHSRKTKQVKYKKEFKYFNIVKLFQGELNGHICGPNLEITYKFSSQNGIVLISNTITKPEALKIINREIMDIFNSFTNQNIRKNQGGKPFSPEYKKGRYYIKRCSSKNHKTSCHNSVMKSYQLSNAFENNFLKWNFKFIEGHG